MKKIIIILVGILVIVAIYRLWGYIGYLRGVQKDGQRLFASHKQFFKAFEFNGAVAEKKYCAECPLNKYHLVVDIREKKPEIVEIGNWAYGGYYFFNDTNKLTLSVTQQIYNAAEKDSSIKKEVNSDSLNLPGLKCRLLSDQKMQWLAEDK
jgi:hypothetical protein